MRVLVAARSAKVPTKGTNHSEFGDGRSWKLESFSFMVVIFSSSNALEFFSQSLKQIKAVVIVVDFLIFLPSSRFLVDESSEQPVRSVKT